MDPQLMQMYADVEGAQLVPCKEPHPKQETEVPPSVLIQGHLLFVLTFLIAWVVKEMATARRSGGPSPS